MEPAGQCYEIDVTLRDAAKFILGAVADGYGDPVEARRLALQLARETNERPMMERALELISLRNHEHS